MANSDFKQINNLEYDDHLEKLLKEQAEIAESLSILHRNAHRKYSRYTNLINIPVIVGSSVVGFTTGLDLSYISNINVALGIVSVFIGIIKSLDSYFQLGRVSETHRMVSLAYSQINKKIAVELALNRKDRISPKDMLSIVKTDVKNLEDISPLLPEDILNEYKDEFGHNYENIKKPNITNGLSPVEINKSSENKGTITLVADIVNKAESRVQTVLPYDSGNFQSRYPSSDSVKIYERRVNVVPLESTTQVNNSEYQTNQSIRSHISNVEPENINIDVTPPDLGEPM